MEATRTSTMHWGSSERAREGGLKGDESTKAAGERGRVRSVRFALVSVATAIPGWPRVYQVQRRALKPIDRASVVRRPDRLDRILVLLRYLVFVRDSGAGMVLVWVVLL